MGKKTLFSENEYVSMRNELVERIKIINAQASSALMAVLAAWTAGITLVMTLYSGKLSFPNIYEATAIRFLGAIIFLIPVYFFVPLSVKSGENLIQIASLSAYIRVFFEYPVIHKKEKMNWETSNNLLSNTNVDKDKKSKIMKLYNEEYTILSLFSLIMYTIVAGVNVKKLFLLYENNVINVYFLVISVGLYMIFAVLSLVAISVINKASGMKYTLMKYTIYYVNGYIDRARELGIVSDEKLQEIISELNPHKQMDLKKYF